MELHPYTANKAPTETLALRPKLLTWTSRVWRESPVRTMPLFKIEGRLEPREVECRLCVHMPRSCRSSRSTCCTRRRRRGWRHGRWGASTSMPKAPTCSSTTSGASNGALQLSLMQTASAATDIVISVVPMRVEAHNLAFAVASYDFGIHSRIG